MRFKTCRLLLGNVWNRELSIIQRRILRRLRKKKSSIKRNLSSRENLNSYIQLQTTRKLSLFYGDLPITEMHRGRREGTSYIHFLLNLERRLDVILVRIHFCETIPQARQLISHRRICVNNGIVSITHFQVSQGDLISFQENDAKTRCSDIRRSFYIETIVSNQIGTFLDLPVRMWRKRKTPFLRRLITQRGCRALLTSDLLEKLRSSMQEEDLERTKMYGSEKVCLGSFFAEHKRMKRNFYSFKSLLLLSIRGIVTSRLLSIVRALNGTSPLRSIVRAIARNLSLKRRALALKGTSPLRHNPPTKTRSQIIYYSSLYSNWTYCSTSPHQLTMKRKRKRSELPTHYLEVNYRTLKAVVFYGPNIGKIPHNI